MPFGYWRCNYRMRGCNPFNVNSDLISLQNGFWLLERTTTKWVLVSFLQDAQVLKIDFLQNDPCQPFYMGLKATHFVVEMGMGMCREKKDIILGGFINLRATLGVSSARWGRVKTGCWREATCWGRQCKKKQICDVLRAALTPEAR